MSRKIILGLLVSFIFGQSNPIDIATSGARQLRMFGQLNVSHNPATLGYYAIAVEADTLNMGEDIDSLISEFSQDINQGEDLDIEYSEFDDFGDQSEEKIVITEDFLSDSIVVDTAVGNSNFSMSIFNLSFGLSSGSITPDWINNQLFGGRDLRNSKERKDFLSGISEDMNIQVPLVSALPLLNISFGSTVIGLGQVRSYTSVKIPSDLAQVPFIGLEKGEELDINDFGVEHITYLPVSYSKGFVLQPGLIPFGRKSYAGVRASLLVGLAEVHTEKVSGILLGTTNNTLIDADIEMNASLPISTDDGWIPKASLSFGLGLDLGLITEIDDKLTVGVSIDNLIASFNWSGATIYRATVAGEITPEELSESDSLSDYLDQSEIKEIGDYKTRLPMSINLSGTYLAKEWVTLDANFRLDIGDTYWASKTPLISIGSEFYPGSKVPLFFGISLGGHNGFIWGAGLSIKMGSVIMDLGGGQEGGIFNNAKGMRAGFGLRYEK